MSTLGILMDYKVWADELLFDALARVPVATLTAPQAIVFGSILRTVNHTLAMDEVWRAHLMDVPHRHTTRNPDACPPLSTIREQQRAVDTWYVDYARRLAPGADAERVSFEFIGGGAGSMTREEILLHVVNHGTYHRGHVTAMMYEAGATPPTTDLPVYLHATAGTGG